MELKIGTNIKRLRLSKGITQEQLAELLSISTAAVSKWEAKNSYPDITLLFPLAQIFGVSIDELLGYDEEKAKEEAEKLVSEYNELHHKGYFEEASRLIVAAKAKYPHDYLVMQTYMWDKAGGYANNRSEVLLEFENEFNQICDCILDGCSNENIRVDALTMKAKILHANNDTVGSFEILSKLPKRGYTFEQKAEQLFGKDTPEYRYWNRRNCYALMDGMANKLARTVVFDDALTRQEKIAKAETMGDEIFNLSQKEGMEIFAIAVQMVYAVAAGMLNENDSINDVIRLREKQLVAMEKLMSLSKDDEVLKESLERTYKTKNLVAWKVNILLNSPHWQFAQLRKNKTYMDFLKKWEIRCAK